VLLMPGRDNAAAMAFLNFITTPGARALIRSYGYEAAP
jgi:ABC-type molybdate transport system substrate-binding protein